MIYILGAMIIFVCVKSVPDTETKIRLKAGDEGQALDTSQIQWIMNPYDEFAVEEALQFRAKHGQGAKVVALSLGPKERATEVLRTALAMGADEGVCIESETFLDSAGTATGLAAAIQAIEPNRENWGWIYTGKVAIDTNQGVGAQMLAACLQLPHVNGIMKSDYTEKGVVVEREGDEGKRWVLQVPCPAVLGATKGLNAPRYVSLPGIMKAKKKPISYKSLEALGFTQEKGQQVRFVDFQLPPTRPAVKMIEGDTSQQVTRLVELLRDEAKVL